jgi:hypothetical protein
MENNNKEENNQIFEEILFKNEKSKRHKKKLTWKYYYKDLLSKDKIVFSEQEIKLIKDLLYNPRPNSQRRTFYLIASGAKREMLNNPNYYYKLLSIFPKKIPFPYEESIDLDLHRTFPEIDYFKDENNLQKLKNILMAFAMRNITIGYCQGFNYIVGKLLLIMEDEEETFWVFTQIAENYLPFDFYLKFTGVRTDAEIVKKIIKLTLNYTENIECIELCISNLITKCFISLFSQTVNDEILHTIWDAFFIYGNIILYRAFIWVVYLLFDKNIKTAFIEDIHQILIERMQKENNTNSLNYFLMIYNRFNEEYIEHYRKCLSEKTLKENFIDSIDPNNKDKCDVSMPFCLCNKEGNDVLRFSQYNILRCNKDYPYSENYFFSDCYKNNNSNFTNSITINDLMIERQEHCCK